MPALRDILNHYILKSVVTFEMVELSLENRKHGLPSFLRMEDINYLWLGSGRSRRLRRKSTIPSAARLCPFGYE